MVIDTPIDNIPTHAEWAYYEQKSQDTPLFRCIVHAAKKFTVHPDYILTVIRAEGGKSGEWSVNNDGSRDVGLMQINFETWSKEFQRMGVFVNWVAVLYDDCSNVQVGTKIIKMRQSTSKTALTALANYHWFQSADFNKPHYVYKKRLIPIYRKVLKEKLAYLKSDFSEKLDSLKLTKK